MAKEGIAFIPEAAYSYVLTNKWDLPKKIKNEKALIEIVEENLKEALAKVPGDAFACGRCEHPIQSPDTFCWFCGDALEDAGGFVLTDKIEFPIVKNGNGAGKKEYEEPKVESKEAKTEEAKPEAAPEVAKEAPKPVEAKPEETTKEDEGDATEGPEDSGEAPVEASAETAMAKTEEVEQSPSRPLKEYTSEIRGMNMNMGGWAWKAGRLLQEIQAGKVYSQGGHATMQDYVASDLEFTWQVARNYIRYSQTVDNELTAQKLGVFRLEILSRSPEAAKNRLLKAALPKEDGGKGMSRSQLVKELDDEKKKEQEKTGKKKSAGGRKKSLTTPIKKLIGQSFLVKMDEKMEEGTKDLEGFGIKVNVTVLKASIKLVFEKIEEVK